jgi:hypothetical protein
MGESVCLIKCAHCQEKFRSPIQFMTQAAFISCSLVGNVVTCPSCRRDTHCNKENMYFNDREGNVSHGSDTIPM